MTETQTTTGRDERGRFQPGQSGNPAGKKPGTLNHATRLRRSLEAGDFDAAARGIAARARKGEFAAARFLVDRLDPKPRNRPIELDIPDDATLVERLAAVSRAMCRGEITPDEAKTAVAVFEREDAARTRQASPTVTAPVLHSACTSSSGPVVREPASRSALLQSTSLSRPGGPAPLDRDPRRVPAGVAPAFDLQIAA